MRQKYQQPGARLTGRERCRFRVWAPNARTVDLHLVCPRDEMLPMERAGSGYFELELEGVGPGARYLYRLDGTRERPDPASHLQPLGVHGPSEVVDPSYPWGDDDWAELPLERYVIYELHVGAFSPEGTFAGVEQQLPRLAELGVTALELMPVAPFPGERNWGYDGVYPHAVQLSYGGPTGLKRLVDACHRHGLALILDVVYNHLGPEGNYLWDFGPYFTDRYRTPWGDAVNFDGPHSDEVRAYFIASALRWIDEFHVDALRLDALHAIFDFSARTFLEELAAAVHETTRPGRRAQLIGESDLNDTRLIRPRDRGGFGLDAQWSDDLHHALHSLLTGERRGYYCDFGELEHLARALRDGYAYSGQYSQFRRRRHGNDPRDEPARRFVVCCQNHDQVGNRMRGDRLAALVDLESQKLAAVTVLLSPYVPLIFMGEEYGETAPFLYFVSHGDPELVQAVQEGRRAEFAEFQEGGEPPDPQAEQTFLRSRIDPRREEGGPLHRLYRTLLGLRRDHPVLRHPSKTRHEVSELEGAEGLLVRRWHEQDQLALLLHFGPMPGHVTIDLPDGDWRPLLHTAAARWDGPGSDVSRALRRGAVVELSPRSALLLERDGD